MISRLDKFGDNFTNTLCQIGIFVSFRKVIDDKTYADLVQNIMKIHIGCARQRKEVLVHVYNLLQETVWSLHIFTLEGDDIGVQACLQMHTPDKAYGRRVSQNHHRKLSKWLLKIRCVAKL